MYNQDQETVNYIWKHLHKGFTEADIRAHMAGGGWSEETIDRAFQNYYAAAGVPIPVPQPIPPAPDLPQKQRFNKWLLIFPVVIISLIVAIFVIMSMDTSKKDALDTTTNPTTSSSSNSNSATSRNARNTARKSDAIAVAAALNEYLSNNAGSFPDSTITGVTPKTLDLCNATCEPSGASSAELTTYLPGNIRLQPYAIGITLTDIDTMYILTGASCNELGDQPVQSSGRSAVILFGQEGTGNRVNQTCISI